MKYYLQYIVKRERQKNSSEEKNMEVILAAAISGGLALIGVIVTVLAGNKKTENSIKTAQAVTDTKIDELTREVREHNNFARRMPVVENDVKTIYKRLDRLEVQNNDGK